MPPRFKTGAPEKALGALGMALRAPGMSLGAPGKAYSAPEKRSEPAPVFGPHRSEARGRERHVSERMSCRAAGQSAKRRSATVSIAWEAASAADAMPIRINVHGSIAQEPDECDPELFRQVNGERRRRPDRGD